MKEFNKLVRDKIPDIIKSNGEVPICLILNDEEYLRELNIKLLVEVNEFLARGEVVELSYLEAVLRAIVCIKGVDEDDFDIIRLSKATKRGAFNDKIFLERTE